MQIPMVGTLRRLLGAPVAAVTNPVDGTPVGLQTADPPALIGRAPSRRRWQTVRMTALDAPINRLDGTHTSLADLAAGRAALVVNVASECDYTPQYTALEAMHRRYADTGFTVIGVPCDQFDAQEPGTASEIAGFCSTTYGVTFPMTEKVNVNPPEQHEVYRVLTRVADDTGTDGDVEWNFEKFLLDKEGQVVRRFRPETEPDDPMVVAAVESLIQSH